MDSWRAFEREVKSEEKSGNGGVQHDADHEWITFSRVMSKAIDTQKKRNAKSATEQQITPYGLAAHGMGTGGRQQPGGRPPACDLCDGFKCPHESDANSPCDVYAFSVSQHRAKEIIDDPPLKAFVDRNASATAKPDQLPATDGAAEAEARAVRRPQGDALRREREGWQRRKRSSRTPSSSQRTQRAIDRVRTAAG